MNGEIVIYNASRLHNINLTLRRFCTSQPLHESLRNIVNIFTRVKLHSTSKYASLASLFFTSKYFFNAGDPFIIPQGE